MLVYMIFSPGEFHGVVFKMCLLFSILIKFVYLTFSITFHFYLKISTLVVNVVYKADVVGKLATNQMREY